MMKEQTSAKCRLVVGGFVVMGMLCFSSRPLDALPWATPSLTTASRPANGAVDMQVCFTLGNVAKREACFARQSDEDINACERMKPFNCKPYKEMYEATRQLNVLNGQVLALAKKKYASYQNSDPAYLTNLAGSIRAASSAWTSYRDTRCRLEPLLDGMSRAESSNLTEACRAAMTNARIKKLRDEVEKLKE
jgi:hypothetical protein